MQTAVQAFLQSVKEREHILQLIRQTKLNVILVHNDERIVVTLQKGEIHLQQDSEFSPQEIEIFGDIPSLISGREPLRDLIRKGQIHLNAPFRTILLLESIFHLGKPCEVLEKII